MAKTNQRVRIAIDAMGGDYAPEEIIKGAVMAAEQEDVDIILVGPKGKVEAELAKYDIANLPISHVDAKEYISEEKNPALAVRRKPNSSIAVATRMLKSEDADVLLGATATGALVTSAMNFLGMIDGIHRPVIGGVLASAAPKTAIFDFGVNVDCKPQHLLTFAIIGSVYAKIFLDVPKPTVALLNIGREENKGNRLVQEAHRLLDKSGLNFIGNIEGGDILSGRANVVVCDAFVGNVLLKFSESGAELIGGYLKEKVSQYPVLGGWLKGKIQKVMASLSSPDIVAGGLIWGVDGIVFKIHGHSKAPDLVAKIAQAKKAAEGDVVNCVKSELTRVREKLNF